MKETDTGNQNASALQCEKHKQATRVPKWRVWPTVAVILTLLAAAGGGIWTILWFSAAFTDTAVAVNFIVVNILSLFVLLAIIAQACLYLGQRSVMRKQWTAMLDGLERTDQIIESMEGQSKAVEAQAEIMHSQRKAMWNQADAMVAQAQITKEAYQTSERAYLAITTARLDDFKPRQIPTITVTIENGGRTPAWDVWLRGRVVMTHKRYPFKYTRKAETSATDTVINVILPNRDRLLYMKLKGVVVDEKIYGRVQTGLHRMFFQGELCYRDICGDNQTVSVRMIYKPWKGAFGDYREEWETDDEEQENPN